MISAEADIELRQSAGGASLATALHAVDANGAVVAFGNSSGEMTSISFADFRRGQNAQIMDNGDSPGVLVYKLIQRPDDA